MRFHMMTFLIGVSLWTPAIAAEFPTFRRQVIDSEIGKVCYAVSTTDVNGDGKLDVVAVSENRIQWYENPAWQKHVILEDQTERDNVCLAAHDIDGDGQIDFAVGAGWTKIGTLQWISRQADPKVLWKVNFIGQELSTHRMSFADVLGKGKPQLVVSPLNRSVAEGARLLAFEIPKNPVTDRWQAIPLDSTLNRLHAHTHIDWNPGRDMETLTASQEGVHLIDLKRPAAFANRKLVEGASGTSPEQKGAGEVKSGQLRWNAKGGSILSSRQYLATIEPMHGTAAVVYISENDERTQWKRVVLETGLKQGHALWTVDLNYDGYDEIVVGFREKGTALTNGPGLMVFECVDPKNSDGPTGSTWKKHIIDDGGCAVEDALAADLNGDGQPDLIAGGRATHNVVIYWNELSNIPDFLK